MCSINESTQNLSPHSIEPEVFITFLTNLHEPEKTQTTTRGKRIAERKKRPRPHHLSHHKITVNELPSNVKRGKLIDLPHENSRPQWQWTKKHAIRKNCNWLFNADFRSVSALIRSFSFSHTTRLSMHSAFKSWKIMWFSWEIERCQAFAVYRT